MLKKGMSFVIAAAVFALGLSAFAEEVTTAVSPKQDQSQLRDQKKDGTGNQTGTIKQDRDRTGEHQGSGSGSGSGRKRQGSSMRGGTGGGRL